MGRNKTLRTREAGVLVEQVLYSRAQRSDDSRVRSIKKKETTEVMKRYNHRSSIQKFAMMLAANFEAGAVVGCLTYDDKHLPKDRKSAERRFRYFRQKLTAHYKAQGIELVVFWSTQHKHGDGRWHHHFVLTATGNDYAAIRAAWIYGDNIELDRLQVNDKKNYLTLAKYYAAEARDKLGLRSWSYTRNAAHPQEDTERVDSSMHLEVPKGVKLIDSHRTETPFGTFEYIMYARPKFKKTRNKAKPKVKV